MCTNKALETLQLGIGTFAPFENHLEIPRRILDAAVKMLTCFYGPNTMGLRKTRKFLLISGRKPSECRSLQNFVSQISKVILLPPLIALGRRGEGGRRRIFSCFCISPLLFSNANQVAIRSGPGTNLVVSRTGAVLERLRSGTGTEPARAGNTAGLNRRGRGIALELLTSSSGAAPEPGRSRFSVRLATRTVVISGNIERLDSAPDPRRSAKTPLQEHPRDPPPVVHPEVRRCLHPPGF
jgi:hypothetical protein